MHSFLMTKMNEKYTKSIHSLKDINNHSECGLNMNLTLFLILHKELNIIYKCVCICVCV